MYNVNLEPSMKPTVVPYPPQIDVEVLGEQALAVAEAKGWDSWSLRDVAASLGGTANALYRHVGDRAGLVVAMGEAATRQLHAYAFEDLPRPTARDVDRAVVAYTKRFVEFARSNPDRYAAFVNAKPDIEHPGILAWVELWSAANALVRQAVPDAADAAGFALWAFLHGRIGIANGPAKLAAMDAGLEDAVRALLEGFRARSPVESPLPPHARRDPF